MGFNFGPGFRSGREDQPVGGRESYSREGIPPGQLGCTTSLAWAGAILVVIFVIWTTFASFYTEWTWFDSLGFLKIFTTIFFTQLTIFVIGTAVFAAVMIANLLLARRLSSRRELWFIPRQEMIGQTRWMSLLIIGGSIFIGLILGADAAGNWEIVLRYLNAAPFGSTDPLFGKDIGFYVFTLPFYRFIEYWLLFATILVIAGTVLVYGFNFARRSFHLTLTSVVKGHVSALGSILFLLLAWNFRLDLYELVYSTRGAVFGAGFTDANAQQGALQLLTVLAAVGAILLLANIFLRTTWIPAACVIALVVVGIGAAGIYPALVQQFEVQPSELAKEKPYIENNIRMTRQAFGLDKVDEQPFSAEDTVSGEAIQQNPGTINNVRLWDDSPLKDTYNQIQTIRLYYDFYDVDVDRYQVDGQLRQVVISARELSPDKLAQAAQTWVNQRLQYTHGYGVAMSPVNEVTPEGLPVMFAKDVPPTGVIKIDRPEIYYGEKTNNYVIVNTNATEFDYPKGDENVYTNYAGQGGILLNSPMRKLAFAWLLNDGNIVLTNYLNDNSRILYRRNIQDRVQKIAPFVMFDKDPYIVVSNGRLVWIIDGYTYTDRYPYSEPYRGGLNYIRNSVKVTIDAYDGSMKFYVADPSDPIIKTYAAIFPTLFTSLDDMPASLKEHIRYPEGLFQVQAEMYRTYHMQDPQVFYNREDLWSIPQEAQTGVPQPIQPYYTVMKLPGANQAEFILMLPYAPTNKDNMITWLAARSDGQEYGKLLAYRFPKEKLVYGPMQIEARINQDPTISSQLTLWNQQGSRVIRGNLIVIPVDNSLLYVEPIYLQAESSHLPELKRVVVANGTRISMEASLADSLRKIFDIGPGATAISQTTTFTPTTTLTPTVSTDVASLIQSAQDHYSKSLDYLRSADWTKYGEEMKALEADLKRLSDLSGTSTPASTTP